MGVWEYGSVWITHTTNASLLNLPILLPGCSLEFGCPLSYTSNSHWIYRPRHDADMRVFVRLFCRSHPESDHELYPNFLFVPTREPLHRQTMCRKVIHLEKTF